MSHNALLIVLGSALGAALAALLVRCRLAAPGREIELHPPETTDETQQ